MSGETFGDRLKTEREDRGLSIEAVAERLHVEAAVLRALEGNEFERLPDRAAMMECLHAYADCLDVDAELMIEDYLQERGGAPAPSEDVSVEPVAAPPPVDEAVLATLAGRAQSRPGIPLGLVATAVAAVVVVLVTWGVFSRDRTSAPESAEAETPIESQVLSSRTVTEVAPPPAAPPAETPVELPEPETEAPPTPREPSATRSTSPPADPTAAAPAPAPRVEPPATRVELATPAPSGLVIAESGVGTGVENRQLVGRSDRFRIGSQVHFWTRVLGATRGDRIEHVWLRDGVEVTRVSLVIGGPSWRTYSALTLHASTTGNWSVEARDEAGRVLARSEFACVP